METPRTHRRLAALLGLIALLGALLAPAAPARAQTNAMMAGCQDGVGDVEQLTQLIASVNAGGSTGVIGLSPGCVYTLERPYRDGAGSGLPPVRLPLTILGNGATIRRDLGNPLPFRLLTARAELTLADLTLEGGADTPAEPGGGAVSSTRPLTLLNVTLSSNRATGGGAVMAFGPLRISGGIFLSNQASGSGGAVTAYNQLEVMGARFALNGANGAGGAIYVADARFPALVRQSSFNGNSAAGGAEPRGGAIAALATLEVEQSVFAGNRSEGPGGAIYAGQALQLRSSSFHNNQVTGPSLSGGALHLAASAGVSDIVNNLLVDNGHEDANLEVTTGQALCLFCGGQSQGYARLIHNTLVQRAEGRVSAVITASGSSLMRNNIISGFATGAIWYTGLVASNGADTNLFHRTARPIDGLAAGDNIVGEDPLFYNPALLDFRIQAESPARGQADSDLADYDRDGVSRPQGGAPDIGAFEYDEGQSRTGEQIVLRCAAGQPGDVAALAAAIEQANQRPGRQEIELYGDCRYSLRAPLAGYSGLPPISDPLVIRGSGQTIARDPRAERPFRLLELRNAHLELSGLTLEGGDLGESGEYGGAIRAYAERVTAARLELRNIVMRGNRATFGGAIAAWDTTITLSGGELRANSAQGRPRVSGQLPAGGALWLFGGVLSISDSRFEANAAGEGGAIASDRTWLVISRSRLMDNRAAAGGAVWINSAPQVVIRESLLAGNSGATGGAAALHVAVAADLLQVIANTVVGDGPEAAMQTGSGGVTIYGNIIAGYRGGVARPAVMVRLDARHNLFFGSPVLGEGLSGDPLFVGPASGDYRLSPGSPAIDASPGGFGTERDIGGRPRPLGRAVDLGAFESDGSEPNPAPEYGAYLPLLRR